MQTEYEKKVQMRVIIPKQKIEEITKKETKRSFQIENEKTGKEKFVDI